MYPELFSSVATDDECALTHLPNESPPSCPECGLTPPVHAAQVSPGAVVGGIAVLGIGAILVLGTGLYVVSSIVGAGFSKGKQFTKRRKRY
jgi:hypothetical protein